MPYKGPKDKKARSQTSNPGLASLAELEGTRGTGPLSGPAKIYSLSADIRRVRTLRKSSTKYLLPKSYVEKLSRRPEIVQAYLRRGAQTSVSPRTLVENLDRLCIQVNEGALFHCLYPMPD